MILTGSKIIKEINNGNLVITPFKTDRVSTNSYDLALGKEYLLYTDEIIDPRKKSNYELKNIPDLGLKLNPGDFILASSEEVIGSEKYVPLIHAKSGIARSGLFVHITADLIDIGSIGTVTFQLYATLPITIYSGMLLGQVTFWNVDGEINLYNGKYQKSNGPQPSKTHLDYIN
ncbi:dCTP deaminase [Photorhabdus viridis]|uniref:dCTP deaminase n=1 Tax=Photorhabdus viridis TaxID=3163327 RepID=UPI00330729AD